MDYSKIYKHGADEDWGGKIVPIYEGGFYTDFGDEVEWYIYRDETYTEETLPAPTHLKGTGTPMTIQYSSDSLLQPQKKSRLTLSVLTHHPVTDIFDGMGYKTRIVVFYRKQGNTDWHQLYWGVFTNRQYNQGINTAYDELSLDFIDILSVLDDIDFNVTSTMRSFGDIIFDMLDRIQGSDNGIKQIMVHQPQNTKEGWWESIDIFRYYINEAAFTDEGDISETDKCGDILDNIANWLGMTFVYNEETLYLIDYSTLTRGVDKSKLDFIQFVRGSNPSTVTSGISIGTLGAVGVADADATLTIDETFTDFKVIATKRDQSVTSTMPEFIDPERMHSCMEDGGDVEYNVHINKAGNGVTWSYSSDESKRVPYYSYILDKQWVDEAGNDWQDTCWVLNNQFLMSDDWQCGGSLWFGERFVPLRMNNMDLSTGTITKTDTFYLGTEWLSSIRKSDIIPAWWERSTKWDAASNDWLYTLNKKWDNDVAPLGLWWDLAYPLGQRPGSLLSQGTFFQRYASYKAAAKPSALKWEYCLTFFYHTVPMSIPIKDNTGKNVSLMQHHRNNFDYYNYNIPEAPTDNMLSVTLTQKPYIVCNGGAIVLSWEYMLSNCGVFPQTEAFSNQPYKWGEAENGIKTDMWKRTVNFKCKVWIDLEDGSKIYFNGSEWKDLVPDPTATPQITGWHWDDDGNFVFEFEDITTINEPRNDQAFTVQADNKAGATVFGQWNKIRNTVSHLEFLSDAEDGWMLRLPNRNIQGYLHFKLYAPDFIGCSYQVPNETNGYISEAQAQSQHIDNASTFYGKGFARVSAVHIRNLKINYYSQSNINDIMNEKDKEYDEDIEYTTSVPNEAGYHNEADELEFGISTYTQGSDSTTFVMESKNMTQTYDYSPYIVRKVLSDGVKQDKEAVNTMQEVKALTRRAEYLSQPRMRYGNILNWSSGIKPFYYFTTRTHETQYVQAPNQSTPTQQRISYLFGTPKTFVLDSFSYDVKRNRAEVDAKEIYSIYD